MAIFDFLTDPLDADSQALAQDVKSLVQDLQRAKPPALSQLLAEARAALADEQALADQVNTLIQDISLFPPSAQPGFLAELQHIRADGQALFDALQAFIRNPTSDRAQLRALADTLGQDDRSVVLDVNGVAHDLNQFAHANPHQALIGAVDLLAQMVEVNPPEPERGFLRTVDGLERAIDVLVHIGEGQPPEPERGVDRAVDTLADTIGALVHTPPPDPERAAAVLDTLARSMDTLVHIGDVQPGPCRGLVTGIDTVVGTIDTLARLGAIPPDPCRELAHTIDVLAQGFAEDVSPGPCRVVDAALNTLADTIATLVIPQDPDRGVGHAIDALAQTIDGLVDAAPIPTGDRGLAHAADALVHTVDALTHAAPIPEPDRVLDLGIHDIAQTIDALVHTLPLIDPMEDAAHVTAVDDAVHAIDVALRGGPDAPAGLILAIDTLAFAVSAVVPCVEPAPERGIELALATLAHTVDFLAHGQPIPEPERVLVAGIDTLVHSLDTLVAPSTEIGPGGGLVPLGGSDFLLH